MPDHVMLLAQILIAAGVGLLFAGMLALGECPEDPGDETVVRVTKGEES